MSAIASDRIVVDILWTRLGAMVNEQARGLQRAAFSHMVREAGDLSVGIFDTHGRLAVQAVTGTPGHIFALPATVRTLLERYPWSQLERGDVLITNDPYIGCGHSYDVSIVTPVFGPDRPVALYGSTCHVVDIGGRPPSADGEDVFEEGLRIPPLKLYRGGEPNEDLLELLRSNVRLPDEVIGDINALVGANEVGGARLVAYIAKLGYDAFDKIAEAVIARSEQAMRKAIAAVPNGRYASETLSDGVTAEDPVRIAVQIDVRGDEIDVDFAGSSGASPKGINVVLNYTRAYATFAIKCALAPDTPNNDGTLRPIAVRAPIGSLLNASEPAPVSMRHVIGHLIPGVVFQALAQAVPDRVPAESAGAVWMTSVHTLGPGGAPGIASFASAGGMGARPTKDGLSCTSFPTGTSAVPIEILEAGSPVLVRSRALTADSGGPGQFRGGCGQELVFEIVGASAGTVVSSIDRIRIPASGAAGGRAGTPGAFHTSGEALNPKGSNRIVAGRPVTLRLPGGGGYGDPRRRTLAAVVRDVVAGYVTVDAAAKHYRVVVDPDDLSLDCEETARLRSDLEPS
jgi:N-methylhydantoinase B/oxoprolinase/acetone carboxylase alpha subunit